MATLCFLTVILSWRSERSQFLRIFELRAELLAYKRLLGLLVPPPLLPVLLDKAHRDSRGAVFGRGGVGGVGSSLRGGSRWGWAGGSVHGGGGIGAAPGDGRFAERFDDASVLFAEGPHASDYVS